MKKIVLATVAMLGCLSTSYAADLPVKAPPLAVAPAYNWNGFYLGAHIGGGWANTDTDHFDNTGIFLNRTSSNKDGVIGGGQIGFNWQFAPSWLVGLEADISGSGIDGSVSGCSNTGCSTTHSKIQDFGTVRGRLGYVANNFLFYGTGGFAWEDSKHDRTVTCVVAGGGICPGGPSPSALTGMNASLSGSHTGWSAGAGIEWGFLPNWTAKIEYLHLQFDNVGRDFSYSGFPTAFRHDNANTGIDVVRVGVNYLFNTGSILPGY